MIKKQKQGKELKVENQIHLLIDLTKANDNVLNAKLGNVLNEININ